MGLIQEFKDFALKGNAVDMAVGIIIGAAFGKVVSSLVNDVLMPPIGMLMGGVDFKDLSVQLKAAGADTWQKLSTDLNASMGKLNQALTDAAAKYMPK